MVIVLVRGQPRAPASSKEQKGGRGHEQLPLCMKEGLQVAKTLYERRTEAEEKIRQLDNWQKQLIQKEKEAERKARTRRLIERGAIVESLIDGAEALTNEEIKAILTAALRSGAAYEAIISARKRWSVATVAEPEAARGHSSRGI